MAGLRTNVARIAQLAQTRAMSSYLKPIDLDPNGPPPPGLMVEHALPMVIVPRFCSVANHGRHWQPHPARNSGQITPKGPPTRNPAVANEAFWQFHWSDPNSLPAGLPPVAPGSPDLRRPVDRMFEAVGSTTNPHYFSLVQDKIKIAKGRLETFVPPMSSTAMLALIRRAISGDADAVNGFMAPLEETIAVFDYVYQPMIASNISVTRSLMHDQLQLIEEHLPGGRGLAALWDEFYPFYFGTVSMFARSWVGAQVAIIKMAYEANPTAHARDTVLESLQGMEKRIPAMGYPFELED